MGINHQQGENLGQLFQQDFREFLQSRQKPNSCCSSPKLAASLAENWWERETSGLPFGA